MNVKMKISRKVLGSLLMLLLIGGAMAQTSETIEIDGAAPGRPFPHFWEQMFGSGRAILSLRESYRDDLRAVKQITGLRYIRFHGIFHDETGFYDEDNQGNPVLNFSYIDQIYDGLLANGARPFVELSFMPNKLAAKPTMQAFWYKPDVSPPKDWTKWDRMITAFVSHLVNRYGIDEVSQWYFEVWNEPNLDFWAGEPRQATYWDLYDHTAGDVKAVNSRLRIGGPATAQAAWADAFIRHCAANHVAVDFVSTHVYGNDKSQDVFGTNENVPRDKMVCRAVKKVHDQIAASEMPKLPLMWSEYNASYFNEPAVTDTAYMGPWLADTIRQCDGMTEMMSYWDFSDVFEEQGVVKTPFYGGFGLVAEDGIPKPVFNAFRLLHKLGDLRIDVESNSALVTKRQDGSLVLALWNYAPPERAGAAKTFTLHFRGGHYSNAVVSVVDPQHGDAQAVDEQIGSPANPTQAQIQQLKQAAELPAPQQTGIKDGQLTLTLPSYALAVIEVN